MSGTYGNAAEAPLMQAAGRSKPRIFKTQQHELIQLFDKKLQLNQRIEHLSRLGCADGILTGINSERSTGIVGDRADLERRKAVYGENVKPLPPPSSIIESFKQEVKQLMWVIIGVTAILAGICGIYSDGWSPIIEAFFIIAIALVIILISAIVDYFKDKQFVTLKDLNLEEAITVIRGKLGATEQVSIWSLVVGDIIMVSEGQRIPADCLVIESADLEVDENPDKTLCVQKKENGDSENQHGRNQNLKLAHERKKAFSSEQYDNGDQYIDPFVRADALVTNGHGKMIVCCTGERSTRGLIQAKLEDETQDTQLQKKLRNLSMQFTKYGIYAGIIIFIILIVMTVVVVTTIEDKRFDVNDPNAPPKKTAAELIFRDLSKNVNLVVVLIVVAIPEGLPLTIQIALAFSVLRMHKRDRILVRKQDALEKIAEVEELLIGKTAIITRNIMNVKKFYLEGKAFDNNRPNTIFNCELNHSTLKLVQEGIMYNNTAYVEMGETKYIPVGNGTEVGFLKFLQNADVPIHTLIKERFERVCATVPRSSEENKQFSACAVDEGDNFINIHIKGAPEAILNMTRSICGKNGDIETMPLSAEPGNLRSSFDNCVEEMAGQPLRVIAFAHADIPKQTWEEQLMDNQGYSANEVLAKILTGGPAPWLDIKLVGAFGLEDKIRGKAKSAIKHTYNAGINVRMISGDMRKTAEAVALQVGLVKEEDLPKSEYVVMDAQAFDAEVHDNLDDPTNFTRFEEIMQHLKVLAKAQPAHKLLILRGLQKMDRKVAVTGGGIADVDAIHKADIGLAMGSGCSAAKEVSDMILTDDDYEATLRAVMWGRNIYHNVSRFLQFQITVNISALLVVACGSFYFGESPLSSAQLLWINVIMDTMAAFALGTEPPLPSVVATEPYKDMQVMQPQIWRQIIGIGLWNFTVIMCVIFFAPMTAGFEWEMQDSPTPAGDGDDAFKGGPAKLRHMTYVFNIFVFLQLFNQINCRKDGVKEYNVFANILHNWYFLFVLAGEFALQFLTTNNIPDVTRTCSLTKKEWGACVMLGSTPLLISALLKCTPRRWVEKFKVGLINESKEEAETGMLKAFNQVNAIQVGSKKDKDDDYKDAAEDDAAGKKNAL